MTARQFVSRLAAMGTDHRCPAASAPGGSASTTRSPREDRDVHGRRGAWPARRVRCGFPERHAALPAPDAQLRHVPERHRRAPAAGGGLESRARSPAPAARRGELASGPVVTPTRYGPETLVLLKQHRAEGELVLTTEEGQAARQLQPGGGQVQPATTSSSLRGTGSSEKMGGKTPAET